MLESAILKTGHHPTERKSVTDPKANLSDKLLIVFSNNVPTDNKAIDKQKFYTVLYGSEADRLNYKNLANNKYKSLLEAYDKDYLGDPASFIEKYGKDLFFTIKPSSSSETIS